MVVETIKKGFSILKNPEKEFGIISKVSFEKIVKDYMSLLLISGFLAGVFTVIFDLVKAFYLDVFFSVEIRYMRLLNYSLGKMMGTLLFYIFIGTFVIFLISIILLSIMNKRKYTSILKVIFYSLTPLLLFSWIGLGVLPLLLWTIILFFIGIKYDGALKKINKKSIDQRD